MARNMKRKICAWVLILVASLLAACGGAEDHIGEAKTPSGSKVMSGRDYQEVLADFEENGFTNIRLEAIDDLVFGWFVKEGEVEKVSVGGDEGYSPDKWIPNDTEVIIYYHVFSSDSISQNEVDSEKTSEPESDNNKSDKDTGFLGWINEGIEEFEFELNPGGKSYTLRKYKNMSNDASEKAIIPSTYNDLPVTAIAQQAFYACHQLESVVIPNGITSIEAYAFYHCDNLESIVIPQSITKIKEYAFEGCDALTTIEIPQAVDVGFRAFYECENLRDVTIGGEESGSMTVDGYAFYRCPNLETVTLGNCITTIETHAFSSCEKLSVVNISNRLTTIGDSAFEYCKNLTEINFFGTSSEWFAIDKQPWWNKDAGKFAVNYMKD